MKNLYEWLPFDVDTNTFDRCRKWLTNPTGTTYYSKGENLLDARLFIPKTKKNDERKQLVMSYASLSNLERWFVVNSHTEENRNIQLHKYARILIDMGHNYKDIETKVLGLNNSLPDKLSEKEITSTIMVTVTKALANKECTE